MFSEVAGKHHADDFFAALQDIQNGFFDAIRKGADTVNPAFDVIEQITRVVAVFQLYSDIGDAFQRRGFGFGDAL